MIQKLVKDIVKKVNKIKCQDVGFEIERIYKKSCNNPLDFLDRVELNLLINRFSNIENEIGVSDALEQHGDLHDVEKRTVNVSNSEDGKASVEVALESIADSEKYCHLCGYALHVIKGQNGEVLDRLCDNCEWQ